LYQPNHDKFSEWQLGIMQAKANAINAAMHHDMECKNVWISQGGLLIFEWEFGKEPIVCLGTTKMTVSEYLAALERLGVVLAGMADEYFQRLDELLKGLQNGLGD
jgi:DnaJ-domain-containing protein 1